MHNLGKIDVSIVAIMASERQLNRSYIEKFDDFTARLKRLKIDHLKLCLPLCYWNICFMNKSIFSESGSRLIELDRELHAVMFPKIEYRFNDFCESRNISSETLNGWNNAQHEWRNAKCDVLAIWSHINEDRDVFVTRDKNFNNCRISLIKMGAKYIATPSEAVLFASSEFL